jgi:adenosine kinase
VRDVAGIGFGLVGPDGAEAMRQHCVEFAEAGTPFIFDPGQALPLFSGEELVRMIEQANYVTVNDYESSLLQDKTGLSTAQIAERVQAYLITRGADGSEIHTRDGMLQIPAATAIRVVDPTGCGDAFRAGLIFGWMNDMDMATTGRVASLMGALKIEQLGPQNQHFDFAQFAEQFRQQFGYSLR